jgi:hypothetical protein
MMSYSYYNIWLYNIIASPILLQTKVIACFTLLPIYMDGDEL